jgi:hypothetical protein
MSKNIVEPEGPQMTSQYGAYALHAGYARLRARRRMHTPTRPGTHTHARERTLAKASLNKQKYTNSVFEKKKVSFLRFGRDSSQTL